MHCNFILVNAQFCLFLWHFWCSAGTIFVIFLLNHVEISILQNSCGAVSSPLTGFPSTATTRWPSILSMVYRIESLVFCTPGFKARWNGAVLRKSDSSLRWMFRMPPLGMSQNFWGKQFPLPALTHISVWKIESALRNCCSLVQTGIRNDKKWNCAAIVWDGYFSRTLLRQ